MTPNGGLTKGEPKDNHCFQFKLGNWTKRTGSDFWNCNCKLLFFGRTRPGNRFLVPLMCRSETKTSRIILFYFLKPKLEVFHKSKEPPNTSFDHGMGVGVASSTKAFLRTHNNYMVSIGSSLSFLFFLLRTSFRTSLNLNIKPTLEKFPCTLGILPCTWLQVVQDTIVWCYHISAHNYHCPHS